MNVRVMYVASAISVVLPVVVFYLRRGWESFFKELIADGVRKELREREDLNARAEELVARKKLKEPNDEYGSLFIIDGTENYRTAPKTVPAPEIEPAPPKRTCDWPVQLVFLLSLLVCAGLFSAFFRRGLR